MLLDFNWHASGVCIICYLILFDALLRFILHGIVFKLTCYILGFKRHASIIFDMLLGFNWNDSALQLDYNWIAIGLTIIQMKASCKCKLFYRSYWTLESLLFPILGNSMTFPLLRSSIDCKQGQEEGRFEKGSEWRVC